MGNCPQEELPAATAAATATTNTNVADFLTLQIMYECPPGGIVGKKNENIVGILFKDGISIPSMWSYGKMREPLGGRTKQRKIGHWRSSLEEILGS